jgi:hypothetical protein
MRGVPTAPAPAQGSRALCGPARQEGILHEVAGGPQAAPGPRRAPIPGSRQASACGASGRLRAVPTDSCLSRLANRAAPGQTAQERRGRADQEQGTDSPGSCATMAGLCVTACPSWFSKRKQLASQPFGFRTIRATGVNTQTKTCAIRHLGYVELARPVRTSRKDSYRH